MTLKVRYATAGMKDTIGLSRPDCTGFNGFRVSSMISMAIREFFSGKFLVWLEE